MADEQRCEFLGRPFALAEKVSALALMRFAKVASGGADTDEMTGLAAMYDLLQQVVNPADWAAFEEHADGVRAQPEDLLAFIQEVFEILSDRPTGPPSVSTDGRQNTSEPSAAGSSSPVITRLEAAGRPDLAAMVRQADQARASRVSA